MINKNSNIQELKSDLKQFKDNVFNLMDLEDKLAVVAMKLDGETVHSVRIKSLEEAKYQSGSRIYQNNITDLMLQEEQLIKKRDYYLYRVKKVETFLQSLKDEQLQLIEYRYWHGYSIRAIEELIPYSKSKIGRDIDKMIETFCEEIL